MIARLWSAHATRDNASRYADHLRSHVLPELRALPGYASAMLLEREASDGVELIVVTVWESLAAIRAFSGPDLEEAVVAEAAAAILSNFDRRVRHYQIIESDGGKRLSEK